MSAAITAAIDVPVGQDVEKGHALEKSISSSEENDISKDQSWEESHQAPVSKWLVIKTDILILPLLTIAFGMQYYDKAILGSATLFGILKDLKLTSSRYDQASACFYYGYLAGAVPMSILAQRWKGNLHIFLGSMVMIWGGTVMLTTVVQDWKGLYVQRVFLGFAESAVSPGFLCVTRMWYTKKEQPIRLGIWWSAVGLFSIVSGLINHDLGKANTSLAPWKLIFLVPGAITVFFGMMLFFLLPPTPLRNAIIPIPGYNRFSEIEKRQIDSKVMTNLTGNERQGSSWSGKQAKEASRDPQIYIFFLMATAIYVTNGAVTVFGPILVKSIGFTSIRAIILLTPGGATAAVSIWAVSYLATRKWILHTPFARTGLHVVSCWPILIGAIMCWKGNWTNKAIPLAGYYLLPIFGAPFVLLLGNATANIAGGTKQALASAAIFLGYNCGNIASSYILNAQESREHYPQTFKILIGCMSATMLLAVIQGLWLHSQNKLRDRKYGQDESIVNDQVAELAMSQDLTDRENIHFRYLY